MMGVSPKYQISGNRLQRVIPFAFFIFFLGLLTATGIQCLEAAQNESVPNSPSIAHQPVGTANQGVDTLAGLKFSGEVVSRFMYVRNENFASNKVSGEPRTSDDDWSVMRFRFRFGAEYKTPQDVRLAFRLSSGDTSYPSSGFQFPLNDFRRFPIGIDRANISFSPSGSLEIRLGIQPNPLFTPTEILWDADVHPIGSSQIFKFGPRVTFTAGQFWLREVRSTKDADPKTQRSFLFAEQLAYTVPSKKSTTKVSAASYHYTNPHTAARSIQTGEFSSDFKTNRFNPVGTMIQDPKDSTRKVPINYFSGFSFLNLGLETKFNRFPLSIAADAVWNRGARSDGRLGPIYASKKDFAIGCMVRHGKTQKKHDSRFGLGFFHIEADAALAPYNNDEIQQTNVNSALLEWTYMYSPDMAITLESYISRKEDRDLPTFGGFVNDQNALRVRSNLRFAAKF